MNPLYFLAVIPSLIWGSMGLFVRNVDLPAWVIYFCAALFSSALFAVLLLKERKISPIFSSPRLWILLNMAAFNVLNNVSYFYAYQLTTISNSVFLHYLAPVLVVIISPWLLNESAHKRVVLSSLLSLFGLALITKPSVAMDYANLLGMFLAILSAVGYAFGVVLSRKASRYFEPKQILFSNMFFSMLMVLPFFVVINPPMSPSALPALLTLGVVHQGIAVLLFYHALKHLKAQNVSAVTYLEPVSATILAAVFLAEYPPLTTLIGGTIILSACYLTVRKSSFENS